MISVIIPIYNIESYIESTILSVTAQTYTDFELLLINDGSRDSSEAICQRLAAQDSRIQVITKKNGGVSSARNLGLDLAKGDFLDGDDRIHPECLQQLMEKMTPETDIVFCDYNEVNDDGFVSDLVLQHKRFEGMITSTEAMEDLFKAQIYPRVVWGKLFRKNFWENLRFNHMAYSEDTNAMFQILQRPCNLYSINQPLYDYLQRGTSASRQKKISEYEDHTETLLELYLYALQNLPAVRSYPGEEYIGVAYGLLKSYQQQKRKKEAMELISDMKFVYETANLPSPSFSRKALKLPAAVFYYLVWFKSKANGS